MSVSDEALFMIAPILGALLAISILFAWNLLRTPFKQRDEAR